jgi:hypothetical protein
MFFQAFVPTLVVGITVAAATIQNSNRLASSAQSKGNTTIFPADLTLECQQSVPISKEDDLVQLAGLGTFVEFQSDLAYLRSPPAGRIYPAIDILAGLNLLSTQLRDDVYKFEYEFQMDVFKLFSLAYDGHLTYIPDIVDVFAFVRLNGEKLRDDGKPDYFSLISLSSTACISWRREELICAGDNKQQHSP